MFHLPFHKRYIAKPQRYSVLGLPYLYLGKSLQVCWEEMGRPKSEDIDIKIALLKPKEELSLLYLNSSIKKDVTKIKLYFFLLLRGIYDISKNNETVKNILVETNLIDCLKNIDNLQSDSEDDYHTIFEVLNEILIGNNTTIENLYKYIKEDLIFQIAKYDDLKYLNECIKYIENASFLLEMQILLFPLHLGCSYVVKDSGRTFKPEYIIPQLVSQYISEYNQNHEKRIDGISYMSTKIHDYSNVPEDYELYTNLALLTYPKQGIDYCNELSKKFKITERISLKDFRSINLEKRLDESEPIKGVAKLYTNENVVPSYYKDTLFSQVEEYLKEQIKYDIN